MRQIRMKFSFVGTRWVGGPPWPAYNEVLETTDEEAAKLVAAGHAVYLEDEPEAKAVGFESLNFLLEDEYTRNKNSEPEPELEYEPEEEESSGPRRPYANEKKELWVAYAVALGEDEEVAARMSKADLISKYGASL